MADPKALQVIGFGFGAIMIAVVLTAAVVVADAQRTRMAEAQHTSELSPAAATKTQ
jgi:hypothetical protein